jgi:uncharacterized protein
MSPEVFDHFYSTTLPQLKKLYGFTDYRVDFFGGEPLMNFDLIKYVTPILKKDRNMTRLGVVTNGLLMDEEKKNYILSNNINYSISFDGLGNKNNRIDVNGNSTYEQYQNHPVLKDMMNFCKVMVSPDTSDIMEDTLIDFVENWHIYSPDFTLVRDNIWTGNDIEKFKVNVRKLADKWIYYIEQGIPLKNSFFTLVLKDSLVYLKYHYKRPFSCFAGYNGAIIMPNGDVYPCMRFGSNNKKPIIVNDEIQYDNYEFFKQDKLNPVKNDKCLKCKLYRFCNMGCKYEQIENNMEPVECVCKLYFILYDEAIRIHNKLKDNKLWIDSIKF